MLHCIFQQRKGSLSKEKFEDTKGINRSHKSKKARQYNGQKTRYKRTNNNLQNTTQKTLNRATRTKLKCSFLMLLSWKGRFYDHTHPSKQTFYRRRPSQWHILRMFCLQVCSRYVLTCCCSTLGETYVSYNHDDNKFINHHKISLQDISAIQNKITISFQTDKTNNKIYEACRRKRTMKVKTKFNIYNVEAQTSSTRM